MALNNKNGTFENLRSVDALTRYGITLLQQERSAILSGSFDQLPDLSDQKAALLDEIESRAEAITREQTTRERHDQRKSLLGVASILSRRASENQNLLSSAINGTKKATEMIERLNTEGASGFYGSTGQKISTPTKDFEAVLKL